MDSRAAEVAFATYMQRARRMDRLDPEQAAEERRHALALAEGFGRPQQVAEACGALCWSETVRFGAPVTELYVRRGLEVVTHAAQYLPQFLEFEGLLFMEQGELELAERSFVEALAQRGPNAASIWAGLGSVRLRAERFDNARVSFAQSLGLCDAADVLGQLRALEGQAEAERHGGDDRAAAASLRRMLELVVRHNRPRRDQARALAALGLVRWRAGRRDDALDAFRSVLELYGGEPGRQHSQSYLFALERFQALRHTSAPVQSWVPVEASPGNAWAIGFLRLGRDALTPAVLPASPPTLYEVNRLAELDSGTELDLALRDPVGRVHRRWFVARAKTLRAERCVLVDVVPDERVRRTP